MISQTYGEMITEKHLQYVGLIGGLAAWRMSQGIYKFDQTMLDEVWRTPIKGEVPVEFLYHIPEWCIYIETPGKTIPVQGKIYPLYGFYAFLECERLRPEFHELRILADYHEEPTVLFQIPLHLCHSNIETMLEQTMNTIIDHGKKEIEIGKTKVGLYNPEMQKVLQAKMERIIFEAQTLENVKPYIGPMLSLLLFVCTQNMEITHPRDETKKPRNPRPKRVGGEERIFPPTNPTTWNVGIRMGAQLRSAEQRLNNAPQGTHAGPRPHSRRAHWHPYWYGKRDSEKRILKLKWLNQMLVNAKPEELVPFVREIDEQNDPT